MILYDHEAKEHKNPQFDFSRPVSANIKWGEIEALFIALGADIQEREGSRVLVRLFGERRGFFTDHIQRRTPIKALSRVSENGCQIMG